MRKEDVPQDEGMNRGLREIAYAVDEQGRYVKVPSLGWEPKNVANAQAWEEITAEVATQLRLIRAGRRSPIAYHLARNLMSVSLLASYVRLPRWRVKRHLKPSVFNRLKPEMIQRYADLFGLTPHELCRIPDADRSFPEEELP